MFDLDGTLAHSSKGEGMKNAFQQSQIPCPDLATLATINDTPLPVTDHLIFSDKMISYIKSRRIQKVE